MTIPIIPSYTCTCRPTVLTFIKGFSANQIQLIDYHIDLYYSLNSHLWWHIINIDVLENCPHLNIQLQDGPEGLFDSINSSPMTLTLLIKCKEKMFDIVKMFDIGKTVHILVNILLIFAFAFLTHQFTSNDNCWYLQMCICKF